MSLATSKTFVISNATYDVSWPSNDEIIEEVLIAKYLGVSNQDKRTNYDRPVWRHNDKS